MLGQEAAEVVLLATRPECRGNGFGSALLAAVEQLCSALGVQQVLVSAAAALAAADAPTGQQQETAADGVAQPDAMQDAEDMTGAKQDISMQVSAPLFSSCSSGWWEMPCCRLKLSGSLQQLTAMHEPRVC